jgi:hypothetical protein
MFTLFVLKSVEEGEWETISDFKSEQKRYARRFAVSNFNFKCPA